MKIYTVKVKEISYGSLEVEADNKEEAEELAYREYQKGNTVWYDSDYEMEVKEPTRSKNRNDMAR